MQSMYTNNQTQQMLNDYCSTPLNLWSTEKQTHIASNFQKDYTISSDEIDDEQWNLTNSIITPKATTQLNNHLKWSDMRAHCPFLHITPEPYPSDPGCTTSSMHSQGTWLGLVATHSDTPYPDILIEVLPPVQQPIQSQTRLGWEQLYHGWFSVAWATAINTMHPKLKQMGDQIMTMILKLIWQYVLETWKLRNNHLHRCATQLNLPDYQQAA